jgi:hypothetical protein
MNRNSVLQNVRPELHSHQCRCAKCRPVMLAADRQSRWLPDPPIAVACLIIAIAAITINLILFS